MNEQDKYWRALLLPLREDIARSAEASDSPARMLDTFQRARASRQLRTKARFLSSAIGATAAAIAACLALYLTALRPPPPAPPPLARLASPPAAPALASLPTAPQTHRSARSARASRLTFYALRGPAAGTPIEHGQVFRLVVPGLSLAEAGVPVSPDRWFENVQADVLFAEDGSARAARLVPRPRAWSK